MNSTVNLDITGYGSSEMHGPTTMTAQKATQVTRCKIIMTHASHDPVMKSGMIVYKMTRGLSGCI